ncbi:MAG: NAD(P)/FAD-dependent oxidoreductase [Alphaproteobacteria bacterium]
MEKIEILIIGAGVVGLAIAREFSLNGRQVVVCEREKTFGAGISARNSGVIHAGIYYPQDSLKAQLCVRGREMLYDYAKAKNIPHLNCGKLIVAGNTEEESTLTAIKDKAARNGVDNLEFLTRAQALQLEPELDCTKALYSPSTGIIDIHILMERLIADIEDHGGLIAYDNAVEMIVPDEDESGFRVFFNNGGDIHAKTLINAAGLSAQRIAGAIRGFEARHIPKLYKAKGNYFSISGKAPFSRLVYPVPVAGGLGAHFTMNMAGESLFGPDVEWLEDADDSAATPEDYSVNPDRAESFYRSIRKYWPSVMDRTLQPAYADIRPKLKGQNMGDSDFVIQNAQHHGVKGLINLFGIESPGLTSSMAIAREVAKADILSIMQK